MTSSPLISFFHFIFALIGILYVMGWENSTMEIVMSEYREWKCLWDRIHLFYKLHVKKYGAWEEMDQLLGC
jgi:hypothetical protein